MAHWPHVRQHALIQGQDKPGPNLVSSNNLSQSSHRVYASIKACDSSRVHQGDVLYGDTIHNHFHVASTECPPPVTHTTSNISSESHHATARASGHPKARVLISKELQKLQEEALKAEQEEEQRQREIRAQKYNTLAESLRFLRMSARLLNVERAAFETCQWIFHHDTYRGWMDDSELADHHGLMWIKGKPGSGKSTIMRLLHDYTASNSYDGITISYFFNGRASGDLEKSSLGLFRHLVSQILEALPVTKDRFLDTFQPKIFNGIVDEWTITELKGFLSDVLCTAERPPVTIFVDALDEGHVDDIRQLVAYLEQLAVRATADKSYLRICLSSRHYPHITIRNGLSLMLDEEDEHNQDIRTFVCSSLEVDAETLLDEVCQRATGVFLWVVLVVPRLNAKMDEGANLSAARALLHKLPTDLDALFTEILDRDAEDIDECVRLLQWASFAQSALSPESLYEALRISSGEPLLTHSELPNKERLRRFFLHRSRGLLEITRDVRPVVQFIHETVRTFLLTSHGLPRIRPALATNIEGFSHEMLKEFCLSFIIQQQGFYERLTSRFHKSKGGFFGVSATEELCCAVNQSMCLHEYVVRYVFRHLSIAEAQGLPQQDSFKLLEEKQLLTTLCHSFLLYGRAWGSSSKLFDIRAHEKVSRIATISEYDLLQLVECMVGTGHPPARFASALTVACSLQNANIARLIIESGIKNNPSMIAEIKRYPVFSSTKVSSLMHATICFAGVDDVRVLLELGMEVNAVIPESNGLHTALQAAVYWNRKDVFDLMIESGADVNQQAGVHGTALHVAAEHGNIDMATALLKLNASVDIKTGLHETALLAALYSGHQGFVKLLLEAGADVNLETSATPLQVAAWSQHTSVDTIELLLAYGARINAPAGTYGRALHAASVRASYEVMMDEAIRLQGDLSNGRSMDRRSSAIAVVKALLSQGALITAEDWREPGLIQAYHELFSYATNNNRVELINSLLNATMEDGSTDGNAIHPLCSAALFGNARQISLLLYYGASPPSEGLNIHSRDYERWIWDKFREQRWYLSGYFDWLLICDDGYCKGEAENTSHIFDDLIFNL